MKEQKRGVEALGLVIEGRLRMPLLLVGEEGVGKRYSVIQAAKQHFSKGDPNSPALLQLSKAVHPDFHIVESDGGKDIGVDAIRDVLVKSLDMPMAAPRRYIVIDGADRLTSAAANAFLKTLEEPPDTTQFVLLAESDRKVLGTIRSRCGLVRYNSLSSALIVEALKDFEPDPLRSLLCARISDGSVGRAIQYAVSGRLKLRDVVVDLLTVGVTGDLSRVFSIVDDAKDNLPLCIRFMRHVIYDLVMLSYDPTRLTNVDIVDTIANLQGRLGPRKIESLRCGLKDLEARSDSKINLPFHTKTFLATVFQG